MAAFAEGWRSAIGGVAHLRVQKPRGRSSPPDLAFHASDICLARAQSRGPGEASKDREEQIGARLFWPLNCCAIAHVAAAILKETFLQSGVGIHCFRNFRKFTKITESFDFRNLGNFRIFCKPSFRLGCHFRRDDFRWIFRFFDLNPLPPTLQRVWCCHPGLGWSA